MRVCVLVLLLCIGFSDGFIKHKIHRARRNVEDETCDPNIIVLIDNYKETWSLALRYLEALGECIPNGYIDFAQCNSRLEELTPDGEDNIASPYNVRSLAEFDNITEVERNREAPACTLDLLVHSGDGTFDYSYIVTITLGEADNDISPLHIELRKEGSESESSTDQVDSDELVEEAERIALDICQRDASSSESSTSDVNVIIAPGANPIRHKRKAAKIVRHKRKALKHTTVKRQVRRSLRHKRSSSPINVLVAFDANLFSGDLGEIAQEIAETVCLDNELDILVSVVSFSLSENSAEELEYTYRGWVWKDECDDISLRIEPSPRAVPDNRLIDILFWDHSNHPEPNVTEAKDRAARDLIICIAEENPGVSESRALFYEYVGPELPESYAELIDAAAHSPFINFVCPQSSGRFSPPDVKCPNYFIACSNGRPFRVDCNGNTRYSSYFGNCVPSYLSLGCELFKEIFFEGNENCIVDAQFVHGFYPIDGVCDRYRICSGGLALEVQCSNDEAYDAYGTRRCEHKESINGPCGNNPEANDPFGETCRGREDGYYQIPNDCSIYCKCDDGVKHIYTCGLGQAFNPDPVTGRKCVPAQSIPGCGPPPEEVIPDFCVQVNYGHDGIYAHPTDCRKVIVCFNEFPLIFNCRPGTEFDTERNKCSAEPARSACDEEEEGKRRKHKIIRRR